MPRNYFDYLEDLTYGLVGSIAGASIYVFGNNAGFPYGLFMAGYAASAAAGSAIFIVVARRCEQRQHNSNYSRNLSREDLLALKRLHDNIEDEVNSDNSATDKVEEIYKSF